LPDAPLGFRHVITLRVHCPVTPESFAALLAGDAGALERDPAAAAVLAAVRSAGLGDFGRYTGVVEAALGVEIFTPTAAARPVIGQAGVTSHCPTVILTTWAEADRPGLDEAVAAIAAAHPWEVPVIEISEARLLRG
jgi:hypothetical protein